MKTRAEHDAYVKNIAQEIKHIAESGGKRINFTHGGTNSTRTEANQDFAFVDITQLNDILEISRDGQYALVEPNVSLDTLLRATLEHNLVPQVIAEFPGITCGGAVNGASLESSAYRYGQFNDTAEEYELVLGNGAIITASRVENEDLFYGISGSYGSLALLTLIKLRLRPAGKYVRVTWEPVQGRQAAVDTLMTRCAESTIEYAEALLFSPNDGVVITGVMTDHAEKEPVAFTHASDPWFYLHAQEVSKSNAVSHEYVPTFDYIFRYNRGAFWMGEYALSLLHFPHHRLMRYVLNPWMNTRKLYDALHATNISQDYFIQDFYVPADKTSEFIAYCDEKLHIYPLWLCPVKPTRDPQKLSPHYIATNMLIDVGIWGQSEKYLQDRIGLNTEFEAYAETVGARKMLYAHAYYSKEAFWRIYDHEWYAALRSKYHAEPGFPEIWDKVHVIPHSFQHHMIRGGLQMVLETFEGKHLGT
jgi:FAD/FMN-containing dehydrogenase